MEGNLARTAAPVRVASLLPAATEIVCALGAGDRLGGISHACDYPPAILGLPRLTLTPIADGGSSGAIDAQVRALQEAGQPVIAVDGAALVRVRPDLILAQDLCDVCAVTEDGLCALPDLLTPAPPVLTLSGRTLEGILEDIRRVGAALELAGSAADLVEQLRFRLAALREVPTPRVPRVMVIEWLEPLYLAGHWVPDLVACAGGVDIGAASGAHSVVTTWDRVTALKPDVAILALCGFGLDRAVSEWQASAEARRVSCPVFALDGNAYTSRPGPRVVEAAELLASAFHGCEVPGVVRIA